MDSCAPSDLAFLLIIYFLVIAGFNGNLGFLMNLDRADATRVVAEDDLLRFEMDGAGGIFFRGEAADIPRARREISAAIAGNASTAVLLSVDGHAPWQHVVQFVELAQTLQVAAFSFALRESAAGVGEIRER